MFLILTLMLAAQPERALPAFPEEYLEFDYVRVISTAERAEMRRRSWGFCVASDRFRDLETCMTLQDGAIFQLARLRHELLGQRHYDPEGYLPNQIRVCQELYDDNSGDVRILEHCLQGVWWATHASDRAGVAQGRFIPDWLREER